MAGGENFVQAFRLAESEREEQGDSPMSIQVCRDQLGRSLPHPPPGNGPDGVVFMEETPQLLTARQYNNLPALMESRPPGFHASIGFPARPYSTAQLFEEMVEKTFGESRVSQLLQRHLTVPANIRERQLFAEFLSIFRDDADVVQGVHARQDSQVVLPIYRSPIPQTRAAAPQTPTTAGDQLRVAHHEAAPSSDRVRRYARLIMERPPVNVQPPLNVEIGLIEISTFFPSWIQIPQVNVRFQRNGATRKDLAKMQLHPVNQLTAENLNTVSLKIQKQNSRAGNMIYTPTKGWDKRIALRDGRQADMTANTWSLQYSTSSNIVFQHHRLKDIYSSVPRQNWPTGGDRLYITQCLEYAADHEDEGLDTSHLDMIIQKINPQIPPLETTTENRDEEAIGRFRRQVPDPPKA